MLARLALGCTLAVTLAGCAPRAGDLPVDTGGGGTAVPTAGDTDGDGVPDASDLCPTVYDPQQADADGDGTSDPCDPDLDGDGVPNPTDRCPSVADADQADLDADGTGDACDPDLDGDGVLNRDDRCPRGEAPTRGQERRREPGCGETPQVNWDPIEVYRGRGGRGSCPYVYLPDGESWRYATDLSGSVLAANVPSFRPAFYGPNLYALDGLEPGDDGYRVRLREVIQESSFVDELALLVVDVAAGHDVHTEWAFTSQLEREPSRGFLTVRDARPPRSAVDDRGRDVLAAISEADGVPLPVREHELSRVVIDLGAVERPEHARLVVTAWGYYGDFTALQRPPYSAGTTVEAAGPGGEWRVVVVAGKAAGDAKTWAIDLGGLLRPGETRLRVTMAHQPTVIDVLDAVLFDDSPPAAVQVTRLEPRAATLGFGGGARVDLSSLRHRIFADDAHLPLNPDALLEGRYTRYGDVRPLLLGPPDDRFAIMAHGDELALEFDQPPPPAPGTARHVFLEADVFYVLRVHAAGNTTTSIEPLPFHGMETYPYDPADWPYRGDASYRAYLATWNTRLVRLPAP